MLELIEMFESTYRYEGWLVHIAQSYWSRQIATDLAQPGRCQTQRRVENMMKKHGYVFWLFASKHLCLNYGAKEWRRLNRTKYDVLSLIRFMRA